MQHNSRDNGIRVRSFSTYNRVEGLPIYGGPVITRRGPRGTTMKAELYGIIRSADTFHWDDQNLGHRIAGDMRVGRGRGYGLGVSSYDVMAPVEPWQLPDPDAALAAFFGHRDFRDWFNRHGAKATATFYTSARSSFSGVIIFM